MQSLPTPLTTQQLEELLAGFPAFCEIRRHDSIVTVRAKHKNGDTHRLLSAASQDGRLWHVMTRPGIISTKFA